MEIRATTYQNGHETYQNDYEKVRAVTVFSSSAGDWLVNEPKDYIKSHITNMIGYSKMIKEECSKHDVPYFDTSTEFEGTILNLLKSFEG